MKKILSLIGSMHTMAILMLIFAFTIGYATIVENDYGTMTAKAEIYNARWFEVLLGLLALNLSYNIYKFKMYKLSKAPLFIFHVAFLVILFGAAVTRYFGYEGTMHIREGGTSSSILSADPYMNVQVNEGSDKKQLSKILYLSKRGNNDFEASFKFKDKKVDVKLVEYIPNAIETLVEDKNGKAIAKLMITGGGKGKPVALEEGKFYNAGNFILDFNSGEEFNKPVIAMYIKDGTLYMKHNMKLSYLKMTDRSKGDLNANENEIFNKRVLYSTDLGGFVLRNFMLHAHKKVVSNPKSILRASGVDALKFLVRSSDAQKEVLVYAQKGLQGMPANVDINGLHVSIAYGSKEIKIPFKIKLRDFQLDRYPGSMSPASYASEVELIDKEMGIDMKYRIYMNHILEHRHYRFFQASYDMDEKGTVLSVNHDPGTLPTYIGYFLLALGMFWALFSKKHRFAKLSAKAKKASECKIVPALLIAGLAFAVTPGKAAELDPAIKTILSFDKNHAQKFGHLVVQDTKGRMKPIDTLSLEVLAKIHRSATLKVGKTELSSNQVLLGMMIRPDIYRDIKLIQTNDEKINEAIGVRKDAKYASFAQFFQDPEGMRGYKILNLVDEASRKAPKDRNKLDKAALKIDEKVNVVYMVFTGSLLKIWPKPNDLNNKWYATIEALKTFDAEQALKVRTIAIEYFTAVDAALSSGDWSKADTGLKKIDEYQKFYGSAVYPSENKIKAEIFYNHSNIFEILWPLYFIMGFVLLILSFVKILKPKFQMEKITKLSLGLLAIFFIVHTLGLTLRWYISGHAPWSNGFESMTYIAWATVLAGFIFSKQSPITLASTSILAGLILFVAHLSWMNPQITNLVPVLNSYWLSIHVSMITASYGFLGLGALLGFITLILFIVKNDKNDKQISLSIKELNAINEMSLMIGLVLLTVGNFLGGVWANESWGRYWGWDPKETWALVTILVYAVVVHVRFIKSIYNDFNYSVISLLAFTSVLMTYFGVNYYLAGMHSYAKGDPVPIPDFVPVTYAIVFVIIALAFRNRKLA
ncbi:cytochrome c biogenesis protein [Sulfurimonas autotrophica]|uniref:Cytochrome c assembly protein n=1 Tax=Sulfurimonas autotrophica (strain ATCC BAA-671 / DSM 16294 / JCM 11897 / OK10) TaxID=563040 RepID=E0US42_SULAO|nr:cytochrome c biogenesis protein CcsA [Sulfurimonas autotrophica]ADN09065.1 cytochrome c assembly protein [Sulfurimonas autotrophica DSM 16294]